MEGGPLYSDQNGGRLIPHKALKYRSSQVTWDTPYILGDNLGYTDPYHVGPIVHPSYDEGYGGVDMRGNFNPFSEGREFNPFGPQPFNPYAPRQ